MSKMPADRQLCPQWADSGPLALLSGIAYRPVIDFKSLFYLSLEFFKMQWTILL